MDAEGTVESRYWWIVTPEASAVVVFAALTVVQAHRLGSGWTTWGQIPTLTLAVLAGYALADVASGRFWS